MEPLRHDNHKNDSKLPSLEMFSASKMSIELDEDNLSESESKSEFEFGMFSTPGSPGSPEKIPNTFPVEEYIVIECFSSDDDSPASARISFSAWRNPLYSSNSNSNNSNNDNNDNNSKTFVIDLCSGIRRSMESNTSVMFTRTNSKETNSPSSSDSEKKKFRQMNRTVSCVSPLGHQRNLSSSCSALPQKNKKMTPLGPSKRWQFIAPAPVLGPSLSMQGMGSNTSGLGMINGFNSGYSNRNSNNNRNNSKKNNNNKNGSNKGGFWRRVFKSFVVKCKACHAMEDQDSVFDLDERRF